MTGMGVESFKDVLFQTVSSHSEAESNVDLCEISPMMMHAFASL